MPAWLDDAARDVRYAVRGLIRRPGFSIAAIATLALGIGAATAIFSVAYGVSLRPLPYPQPDRLVRIYEANLSKGLPAHDVSFGAFQVWRAGVRSIVGIAAVSKPGARTVAHGGPRLATIRVSPSFFDVIGVRPMIGPGFKTEEQYLQSRADEVILSYRTWQLLFGGRSDVIGQIVTLAGAGDDDPYRVVGVMPRDFSFDESPDIWMPEYLPSATAARWRSERTERVIARLAPGAAIPRLQSELDAACAQMSRETPAVSAGWTAAVRPLHASIVGDFARATWLLLAAVAVVLVTACLNVGGLLAARAIARERETAVRMSLGAGAWALIRLWIVEALLLCSAGASLGVLLAWTGVAALKSAAPPGIPRLDAIAIDRPTLVVALASMLVAAVLFTLAPLREARISTSTIGAQPRRPMRMALTAAQCAGAATLVILAAMLSRSFLKLLAIDLGWQPRRVVAVQAEPRTPRENRRPWFARVEWSDRVLAALESSPGVDRAVLTTQLPLGPSPYQVLVGRGQGKTSTDEGRWSVIEHKITDRYFDLMRIRLVEGRAFARDDRFSEPAMTDQARRPDEGVAIVSVKTARTLWPGEPALGKTIWSQICNTKWRRVVGVVNDVQFNAVGEEPALHVFIPWTQDSASARVYVFVKATGSATTAAAAVRDTIRGVAPGAEVDLVAPLESLVERATAQPRFTSRLVAAFGLLALALAAVGIYGTLTFFVSTHVREIGIKIAIGASSRRVLGDILRHALVPAGVGGAMGIGLALAIARAFRALLFGVEPIDAVSLAGGGIVLIAVALAAAAGPARRASAIEPAVALRAE